jgi:hypothetical protein
MGRVMVGAKLQTPARLENRLDGASGGGQGDLGKEGRPGGADIGVGAAKGVLRLDHVRAAQQHA